MSFELYNILIEEKLAAINCRQFLFLYTVLPQQVLHNEIENKQ